jgi:hypothetical protein
MSISAQLRDLGIEELRDYKIKSINYSGYPESSSEKDSEFGAVSNMISP